MPTHALQVWRLSANLSPQQLAQRSKLSKRLIKNIEANPNYNIKMHTARAIASAIGVPAFVIFMPEEHAVLNDMIRRMLRRQESIFSVRTMFSMLRTMPLEIHIHPQNDEDDVGAHDMQSYLKEEQALAREKTASKT